MLHQNPAQATVVNKSLQNRLSLAHLSDIVNKRGINAEWAKANCESMEAGDAKAEIILGYPVKSSGIMFIGRGLQCQYRPDKPWDMGKGSKPKYLTPVKGEVCYDGFLPKHPTDKGYWTVDRLKQNCWKVDGVPYILVTEGVFKAIAGCSNELPTIALMGVTMALKPKSDELVDTLKQYADAGFGFIIGFDADAATNENVFKAEKRLATALSKHGVPARSTAGLWKAEEGKGMDDFIQKNGIEAFRAKLAKAYVWEAADTQKVRSPKIPTPRETSAQLAEDYLARWKFDNEQKCWRAWTGKIWEEVEDGNFDTSLMTAVDAKGIAYPGDSYLSDVRKLLTKRLRVAKWQMWDTKQFINFSNCVLDSATGEALEHSPGMGFKSYLPYEFKPLKTKEKDALKALRLECPHVYAWMLTAMKGDLKKVLKLLAIINGVLKFRFHDLQMFVHLIGKPGTGKGTFTRLLQKIVGEDNYVGCSLKRLDDSSTMAGIIDKQLVTFPDERTPVGVDHILNLTGGDEISYRQVYKPAASAPFYGGIVIASNDPIFIGNTTGLERRLCLVEFDNPLRATDRNSDIEAQMESEIPQLIAVAISLPDAQVREMIQGTGAGSIAEFKMAEWAMRCSSSSLVGFFDEQIIVEEGANTATGKLYDTYKQYCEDSGLKPVCLNKFSKQLNDLLEEMGLDARLYKARNKSSFVNLRLRFDGEDAFTHGEILSEQVLGLLGQCEGNVTTSVRAKTLMGEELEPMLGQNVQNFSDCSISNLESSTGEAEAKPTDEKEREKEREKEGENIGKNVLTDLALTNPQVPHQQDFQPSQQPSQQPSHSPNISPNTLAEAVRKRLADCDKDAAKNLATEINKLGIRREVGALLTAEEDSRFRDFVACGFMKGMHVRYVGRRPDYAHLYDCELVVDEIKVKVWLVEGEEPGNRLGDARLACRKPDGSFTTWLKPSELAKV